MEHPYNTLVKRQNEMHHVPSVATEQQKRFDPKQTIKKIKAIDWRTIFPRFIKNHKRLLLYGTGIIFLILLLIPIFTYIYFAGDLKDKDTITNRNRTGLTLMDEKGKTFFTFYQPKEVTYIPLADMPKTLQQAVVATEDKNFYTNPGFSVRGMARAFVRNLTAGRIVEGGSTISQELVKNALLNSSRNVFRKYQELVLATELNRRFSKEDILEMYLNSVYFGEGAFGVENAAEAYFGIHARELTLSEAALLVGLLPAPSALSPLSNDPERALNKRHIVLTEMVKEQNITQEQADIAESEQPVFNTTTKNQTNTLAPHFALYVKDELIKKYGEERIIREGFKVRTTMNSQWQAYAERVVKNQVLALTRNKATNGAAIVIDPKTGAIKVMVGSYDWNDQKFGTTNMSTSPRQPGSSFKPIIYADALEQKLITPATILHDNPISYGNYTPLDYDKKFRGNVTVRRALANSLNIPAVEVLNTIGINSGLSFAKKMGITTLGSSENYGLSLVLGAGEVKLLELTSAYAVFADQGRYHTPNAILEIKNKYDKTVVEEKKTNPFADLLALFDFTKILQGGNLANETIAMSDDTAYLISSILSDNNARAEEFGGALTISRPAAVKTGTTNDYRDALTIGYTPSLVVGVWVGNNDYSAMDNIAGSLGAAPIWRSLMETYLAGTPVEQFIQPASIVKVPICGATEFFAPGTQLQPCSTPAPTVTPTQSPTPHPTDQPTATPIPTSTPLPTISLPTASPIPTSIVPTISPPVPI